MPMLVVGAEHQEHDSGAEVAQRALHREADGEAGGTEDGDEARRLHPELTQGREHRHRQDRVPDHGVSVRVGCGSASSL